MPAFAVDLSLWPYHSPEERRLLITQLEITAPAVEKRLGPGQLVFVAVPGERREKLEGLAPGRGFSDRIHTEKMVLLDPNAEEELESAEPGTTYIIGAIVDKSRRMKTRTLWYDAPRRKITFKGSAVGVPDRINLIADIICDSLEGKSIDRAVLERMPGREKKARAVMEAARGRTPDQISKLLEIPESLAKKFIQQ